PRSLLRGVGKPGEYPAEPGEGARGSTVSPSAANSLTGCRFIYLIDESCGGTTQACHRIVEGPSRSTPSRRAVGILPRGSKGSSGTARGAAPTPARAQAPRT